MLISGIGIQLTYNKIFGIMMLIYGVANLILMLVKYGRLGGILILITGIFSFVATMKFDKAWEEYVNMGRLPNYIK